MPADRDQVTLEKALGFALSDLGDDLTPEESAALSGTAERLAEYTAPRPTREETARLVESLKPYIPQPSALRFREQMRDVHARELFAGLIGQVAPQIRLLGKAFWVASALVMALGLWLTGELPGRQTLPILMMAPLAVACGVAYAFRHMDERMLEVEASAAVTWQQLVVTRTLVVLAYDTILLLALSPAVSLVVPGVRFWPLLLSWLAPLALWGAVALFVSLKAGYWQAIGASFVVWAIQYMVRIPFPRLNLFAVAASPGDMAVRTAMTVLAAGLLASILIAVRKPERWIVRRLES